MKIDIITRHGTSNYGSLLQTYATQIILSNLGYDSEVIDYIKYEERGKNKAETFLKRSKIWNKNRFTRLIYKIIQTPNHVIMYNKFKKFRMNLLKMTKEYGSLEELKKYCPEADIYCTGSDQVWGKIGTDEFDKTYFLDFVPQNKKCISYSASFGNDDICSNLKKELQKLLEKYDNLMVREESAIRIIEKYTNKSAKLVLDPTLLLSTEQWQNMTTKIKETEKYILVYQLHDNKDFERYAKKFSIYKRLKLIRISPSIHNIFKTGKLKWLPSPEEFITYFANAEYILTDSFHATVFSLIFNKRFINILPSTTGTRIINILDIVGLQDRILKDFDDFKSIDRYIDFKKINKIIEKKRDESLDMLKKALNYKKEDKNG